MLLDLPIKKSSELKNWILQTIKVAVGSDAVKISEGIWQPYKLVLPVHSQESWLVLFLVRVILGEMDPCNLQNGLPLSTTISKMPSAIFRNSKFIYICQLLRQYDHWSKVLQHAAARILQALSLKLQITRNNINIPYLISHCYCVAIRTPTYVNIFSFSINYRHTLVSCKRKLNKRVFMHSSASK